MSDQNNPAAKFQWARWFDWALKLYIALLAAAGLALSAENFAYEAGIWRGTLMPGWGFMTWRDDIPSGWVKLEGGEAGEAFARIGLVRGDLIRFDRPYEFCCSRRLEGAPVGLTLNRNGHVSHHVVTTPSQPATGKMALSRTMWLMQSIWTAIGIGFGLIVLARRWRGKAATTLGLYLLMPALGLPTVPAWISNDLVAGIWVGFVSSSGTLTALSAAFCHYLTDSEISSARHRLIWGWFIFIFINSIFSMRYFIDLHNEPILINPSFFNIFVRIVGFFICLYILYYNYQKSDAIGRNRIKLVATAYFCFTLALSAANLPGFLHVSAASILLLTWAINLLVFAGLILLVYTVLRHKLFDFSFAVNRTLVYAVVSAILLSAFGLAEWAVDKLVPEDWHKASEFYSAGIAVVLFLLFHRIRDWVEHHVERWFFASWHNNEARLRRFIEAAGHYERQDRLMRDTVAEFRRFTGAEHVALFWRKDGEDYGRLAGSMLRKLNRCDADDPALARARVTRGPVCAPDEHSTFPADLILPVIDHGQIAGFVALGPKPDGLDYRPDEIEVMAWAAQQTGLDLQSMRARGLEAKVSALEAQVERLSAILATRKAHA